MSRRGKPLLATSDDDRCMAITPDSDWKRAHKRELRCPFMAKFAFKDVKLCMHHARVEAMALLLESRVIRMIPVPPRQPWQRVKIAIDKKATR